MQVGLSITLMDLK